MPKTANNIWDEVVDFENLYFAYLAARKCKRFAKDVMEYSERLEENLINTQNHLIWKSWTPHRWKEFYVHDPKTRLIQAPQFRDRVVHHALVRVVEPYFEKKFIYDSYACRVNKGTHAAMQRLKHFLQIATRQHSNPYILKCDIRKYFPSIDHYALKKTIRRTIKDENTLWLLDNTIDQEPSGKGLPIGSLTSQLMANVNLDVLDHYCKDEHGIKFYVRYMDDFIIIHHDKEYLKFLLDDLGWFLTTNLGLSLNSKTQIFPYNQGINFCGYRIWPTHVLPRKRTIRKAKNRFRKFSKLYCAGNMSLEDIKPSLMSFLGYAKHCNSYNTVSSIFENLVFKR